jgi:hypothetical protein
MLQKWEMVKVWRPDLRQPHDKYCVCISWERQWFLYFNSQPPQFRKARQHAISVSNFEVQGLLNDTSYMDTTYIVDDLPADYLAAAIADEGRRFGALAPFVRRRICEAVRGHGVLTPEQRNVILAGEPD